MIPLLDRYENLMVLRTFSKWAGLAGMRIGYGLLPPAITDYLLRIKVPYNVSVPAAVAVRESLADADYLQGTVKKIIAERDRLFEKLAGIKWLKPVPSRANFILCRVEKMPAKELRDRLQDKGILVRYFDEPRVADCVRFSVGKPEHTAALIEALKSLD
jgi:histidinol-phosphate aminotransferase